MLSSNSSSRNPNYGPLSENDITSFTSKSEDPNFFLNFPYEDVLYLDHFLAADWSGNNMALDGVSLAVENQPTAARRSLKKDRHSKINTARGPRDRRMRLSLDIARRFFDLQDLLGYDKASRTVDWLLKNSRSAIRDLRRGSTCTSEDGGEAASSSITAAAASSNRKLVGKRGVRVQVQQKRATVARESRRKARERARERTSQKRRLMRENTAQTHAFGEEARICGSSTAEGVLCQWNSFDFQNNINHEFLHQDEQIAEFEFNGKPWEGFNNFN